MRANLIPMQLRGPQPKGMWQRAGRFAFSSGVNLRKRGKDGGQTREEGRRKTVPFWVKCLWFWPEFWIVVHKVDRKLHCHSFRNCHSVDLDGLFSKTWGAAKEHHTALLLSGYTSPPSVYTRTLASHILLLCTNCTIIVCTKLAICTELFTQKLSYSLLSADLPAMALSAFILCMFPDWNSYKYTLTPCMQTAFLVSSRIVYKLHLLWGMNDSFLPWYWRVHPEGLLDHHVQVL